MEDRDINGGQRLEWISMAYLLRINNWYNKTFNVFQSCMFQEFIGVPHKNDPYSVAIFLSLYLPLCALNVK